MVSTEGMITVDVRDSGVVAALQALQGRLKDLSPAMRDVGQALENQTNLRFVAQADPNGTPWADLSEATAKRRARAGTSGNKLDEHGTMLKSLNWQASANTARVGFGQPYAAYHEFGTQRMPRRGLLMADPDQGTLGADDLAQVLDILQGYLDG